MVLWICLAIVLVALGLLGILAFDLMGHLKRFERAVKTAQRETAPQIAVVKTLADVRPQA